MSENPYVNSGPEPENQLSKPKETDWLKWPVRLVLGFLGLVVVASLFWPVTRTAREPARRSQCKNNLKQIALALYNYHDTWGTLPPAAIYDSNGQALHSWRVIILPFIEDGSLYNQIDLTKPWDDPVNEKVRNLPFPVFQCPSANIPRTSTTYRAIIGENYAFHPTQPRSLEDITDGLSNTVLIVETDEEHAVHWMQPDFDGAELFAALNPESKTVHKEGGHAVIGDGSVRFLSNKLTQPKREALMTISGGDDPGEW
ncbi:DUF1559 domain-containing protein [Planctomicrobium sp. SH661]|uniref:DUF1559 domain-containing protein n=1 Tax=Planctomicrobium sp. SH661 TaxID=3448124 RepID=UPI003F5B4D7B